MTKFREFKQKIEGETGNKIKTLRRDRGGEYLSREFTDLCKSSGIQRELTQAHTCEPRNRVFLFKIVFLNTF